MSMTSTTTGLPDRYRPLDQVGPDEPTPTGVIRCWRAKDRVLNRDVAIRVHTPAGPPAHEWITRALTAGGLATPALAMVYDASEGVGDPQAPGGAAYVVNEWIDGETLAERLARGPLPDREIRTVLRRLAEGVAEAHRVGLAVGGLTPDNVVLRPNGLVGLRAVPAATGTVDGDIAALGGLLETCLTGADGAAEGEPLRGPSDLVALVRRARSTEPGQGLSSVAAMATLLAARPPAGPERPRSTGSSASSAPREDADAGWLSRLRDRRADAAASSAAAAAGRAAGRAADSAPDTPDPVRLDPETMPPVPAVRPLTAGSTAISSAALGGDTIDAGTVSPSGGAYAGSGYSPTAPAAAPSAVTPPAVPPTLAVPVPPVRDEPYGGAGDTGYADYGDYGDAGYGDEPFDVLADDDVSRTGERGYGEEGDPETPAGRRRAVVVGLTLLAVAVVVGLAYWFGSSVLSVAGSVDDVQGSTPSASSPVDGSQVPAAPKAGESIPIADGSVYDPFGDGNPDHPGDVPKSFDGNPATEWKTYQYQGSTAFGGLKPGVGVVYDLGSEKSLASVTVAATMTGSTVEIRTGNSPDGNLDSFAVAASGKVAGSTDLAFAKPATARYVLVWITGLVPVENKFQADLAEVTVKAAA
ncbi:MAG: uncharacterized protein JWQ99_1520 [Blastococcus sp.]|nr:uncharacterized protein [Blastococcus sp.]